MIDINKLINYFPFAQTISQEDIALFFQHVKISQLNSGDIFIEKGDNNSTIYFINKGLVRSYYLNGNGKEITLRLKYENQITACYDVVLFNRVSNYFFQALEPTELIALDFGLMEQILEKYSGLEAGRRFFLTQLLAESIESLDDFILLRPEQRYTKYLEKNPGLVNRVPDKYIANVLGITPVSLSRIRKRIALKKR
jgi:CRP-like cAMP-binding protein